MYQTPEFKPMIEKFCANSGWNPNDLKENSASLKFTMDSGRDQILYIIKYNEIVEFSVPSVASFDSDDDIPHMLSTVLMQKNATYKIGSWCIEKISEKQVFSLMYNCYAADMNQSAFERIVKFLLTQCDEFDGAIMEVASGKENNAAPSNDVTGVLFRSGAEEVMKRSVDIIFDILFNKK